MKTQEVYQGKLTLRVSGIQTSSGILETTTPSYASQPSIPPTRLRRELTSVALVTADFCCSKVVQLSS